MAQERGEIRPQEEAAPPEQRRVSRRNVLRYGVWGAGALVVAGGGGVIGWLLRGTATPPLELEKTPTSRPEATPTVLKKEEAMPSQLRQSILTIDETSVPWPKKGQGESGIPVHDKADLDGNKVRGRSILEVRTGSQDFEWVSGGRFAFQGKVAENIGTVDSVSGLALFTKKGDKIIIPGGEDNFLRGNIVFVLGQKDDNTATALEADTASNYREKRNTGLLNQDQLSSEGVNLIAAMGKVYANSMYRGQNCKGEGCRDAVGVYVLRGGDKVSGTGAKLLFGAVYSGKELAGLNLKS